MAESATIEEAGDGHISGPRRRTSGRRIRAGGDVRFVRGRLGRPGVAVAVTLALVAATQVGGDAGPAKSGATIDVRYRPPAVPLPGRPGPQVTILSPVDAAIVQASPLGSPPHHTPFGGDWASDLATLAGSVHARFADPSGTLGLTVEHVFVVCGDSGGMAVTIGVSVDGTRIGAVVYAHLGSVDVGPGPLPNGARLGDLFVDPPVRTRCWGNVHVHVEAENEDGRSCFLPRNPNTDVGLSSALGVLGGGPDQRPPVCAVGQLDSAERVAGGVRLAGWARFAHAPGEAVRVRALVDRKPVGEARADGPRSGVDGHGFSFVVPVDERPHVLCATAGGVAGAADTALSGCHAV